MGSPGFECEYSQNDLVIVMSDGRMLLGIKESFLTSIGTIGTIRLGVYAICEADAIFRRGAHGRTKKVEKTVQTVSVMIVIYGVKIFQSRERERHQSDWKFLRWAVKSIDHVLINYSHDEWTT